MTKLPRRHSFRACFVLALLLIVPALFAGSVEPTATLPPPDGVYTLGDTCVSVVCLTGITISDFVITSSQIVGSDQITMADAVLDATAFQNNGGVPGVFINPIALSGSIGFTFFGRTDLNEVGTFNAQITSFDFLGTFMGLTGPHSIEAMQDPTNPSLGITTVTQVADQFAITSFFDVFGDLSVDGGPFVPGRIVIWNWVRFRNRRALASRWPVSWDSAYCSCDAASVRHNPDRRYMCLAAKSRK